MHPKEIAHILLEYIDPSVKEKKVELEKELKAKQNSFALFFQEHYLRYPKKGTQELYQGTLKKIEKFCIENNVNIEDITFDSINRDWLDSFQRFCEETCSPNTIAIHLRNIRAVFNAAIDENRTSLWRFRRKVTPCVRFKVTPLSDFKMTPSFRFKVTPTFRLKMTPCEIG